jgi:hypothetical protein
METLSLSQDYSINAFIQIICHSECAKVVQLALDLLDKNPIVIKYQ